MKLSLVALLSFYSLLLFVLFYNELSAISPVKRYHMMRNGLGKPVCFQYTLVKFLPIAKIRSKIECSIKCAQFISPYADNKTCNAFNYVDDLLHAAPSVRGCSLYYSMCDVNYLNTLDSGYCLGYEDVDARAAMDKTYTFNMTNGSIPWVYSLKCNFPFTYNGGLFYSCSSELARLDNPCKLFMCLTDKRQLVICLNPFQLQPLNSTTQLTIPTFASPTVISVNGWIVIQQRIDGSQDFNQSWAAYKAGFGAYNQNFWLGLEKIYQLTNAINYKLRLEVYAQGEWFSDEYDHFKIGPESRKYYLNVSGGYSGDHNFDILADQHNGMNFSTTDQDNTPTKSNIGKVYGAGNWFSIFYVQNLNGIYGQTLDYSTPTSNFVSVKYCRMMIKLN